MLVRNSTPSACMSLMRRSMTDLSSFMLGMPYISRPPTRSARSNTVTAWPRLFRYSATDRPDGPLPTTATLLPVRAGGGAAWSQPLA